MKKLKKALSLSLALVLALAMAAPAFAAAPEWNLGIAGKPDSEVAVQYNRTFQLRNWKWNEASRVFTKSNEIENVTADLVIPLEQGETAVITPPGSRMANLQINAWSDPDGDGIYDQRIGEFPNWELRAMPVDIVGPVEAYVSDNDFEGADSRDTVFYYYSDSLGWSDGSFGTFDEVSISANYLLEKFGPNTFLDIVYNDYGTEDDNSYNEYSGGWYVLLSGSGQPTTPTQPEQPTTPTTPVVPGNPGSYTVKKGDTWSSICTNFYGNNGQRYALMNANKNMKLKEGAVITLPEKLGRDTLIPAPVVAAGEKLYTVKAGDTLGRIAAAEYGKASAYKAIFERNADRLKNANTIYEGQVIVLPAK